MKTVVILQHRLLHYRVALFERLREACVQRGIELHLLHGQASRRDSAKRDVGTLCWAHEVKNRYWEVGALDLIWQPFPRELRRADLVILMQENKILSNYPILLSRLWSPRKVAYWGHGVNFQSDAPRGVRETWKRMMLTRVDWWFAYTEKTVDVARDAGYPQSRVTCLDNAIDDESFAQDLAMVGDTKMEELRASIDAPKGAPVGLFCGSLYREKKLDYMITAADSIHRALPDFRLVVIGDGPYADEMRLAMRERPWLHWAGACRGLEKAGWFKVADLVLNPGTVGLHVLDSFCAGTPMVTTSDARHSPEIAYLKNEVNGLIVQGGPKEYGDLVVALLSNPARLYSLKTGALRDARRYTLENMVNRFVNGIERCLSMPAL